MNHSYEDLQWKKNMRDRNKHKMHSLKRDRAPGSMVQPRLVLKHVRLSPVRTEACPMLKWRKGQDNTLLAFSFWNNLSFFSASIKQLNKISDAKVVQGEGWAHSNLAATLGSVIPMMLFAEAKGMQEWEGCGIFLCSFRATEARKHVASEYLNEGPAKPHCSKL